MADLSNPLTQVVVAQAQPAVTVNNLVDALSPAAIFGQNDLTTTGLNWGYYGGRYRGIAIAHSTIALPASQASVYIVAAKATGVVSQSTGTTNWNDSTNYDRLYLATTGASTITDWDDYREVVSSAGAGVATIDTEQIEDIIAALITAGANVTKQYNDGDSPATLVLSATAATWGAITGTLSSQSDLQNALDAKVAQGTFEEQVQDIVATLITAGANVTKQYNGGDSPPTLVISSTGGGGGSSLTQEEVEDIVAALITAGSGITKQYNDGDSPATLVLSSSGGSLTHFTESVTTAAPNASQPVVQLLATNAAADVDIALTPKSGGALTWEIADNTTAGGNKRGQNAVDLTAGTRVNANQVASGQESALIGGAANRASALRSAVIAGNTNLASGSDAGVFAGSTSTASALQSAVLGGSAGTASNTSAVVVGGTTNTASGTDSFAHGNEALADAAYTRAGGYAGTTRGVIGADAWGAGFYNNRGDFNTRRFVLRQRTTDATPAVMTTNGSAAAATNQVNCVSSGAVFITGQVIVQQATTGDSASWTFTNLINNIGGTTAIVGTPTLVVGPASAGAATWTFAITANDTLDTFTFTVTGEASHTLLWVAHVQSVECGPG